MLSDADGSNIYVGGGVTLALPALTSDQQPNNYGVTLQASGIGSVLSLPNLASLSLPNGDGSISVEAYSGGDVELPLLTQATGSVYLDTNSATSTLDAPLLATFTGGQLSDGGGTFNLPALSDANGSNIYVSGGVTLTLPDLTSDQQPNNYGATLQASGIGTVLSLPNLASLSLPNGDGSISVEAYSGGDVELPLLTQATGSVYLDTNSATSTLDAPLLATFTGGQLSDGGGAFNLPALSDANGSNIYVGGGVTLALPDLTSDQQPNNYGVTLQASGIDSVLSLPSLASLSLPNGDGSISVEAYSGGDVELPLLAQSTGSVYLDTNSATSTLNAPLLATFTGGQVSDGGGAFNLPALSDANGSNIYVSGGVTLALPDLTSDQQPNNYGVTLQASGIDSVLSLPNLGSLSLPNGYGSISVEALSGGEVNMPQVTQLASSIPLESEGAGSVLDLPAIQSLGGNGGTESLTITQSGTVIDPNLTTFANAKITTDSTGTFAVPANQTPSFSGTSTIQAGTVLAQGDLSVGNSATSTSKALDDQWPGGAFGGLGLDTRCQRQSPGNTTNVAAFNPAGTVVLDSANGTNNAPQLLEAMSQDLGGGSNGFTNNFAYTTLELTQNTYVELVDQAANSPGGTPEALYVNTLIIPTGSTLNLNGLKLYYNTKQGSGTIVGEFTPPTVQWISTSSGNWNVGSTGAPARSPLRVTRSLSM